MIVKDIHGNEYITEKLSDVLEFCLISGFYENVGCFMCHAVEEMWWCYKIRDIPKQLHIDKIAELVVRINPSSGSLAGALVAISPRFIEEEIMDVWEMAHQLYVWWIFDLKRKGL